MAKIRIDSVSLRELARLIADRLKPVVRRASLVASDSAMMTMAEVMDYIKISRTQLYHLRRGTLTAAGAPLPVFPKPRHNGSCLTWKRAEIDSWLSKLPRFTELSAN